MANIEVSNLTGSNLLLDEETYLNELSDEVTTQSYGGTSSPGCIATFIASAAVTAATKAL